jgi:hypothetical protein
MAVSAQSSRAQSCDSNKHLGCSALPLRPDESRTSTSSHRRHQQVLQYRATKKPADLRQHWLCVFKLIANSTTMQSERTPCLHQPCDVRFLACSSQHLHDGMPPPILLPTTYPPGAPYGLEQLPESIESTMPAADVGSPESEPDTLHHPHALSELQLLA